MKDKRSLVLTLVGLITLFIVVIGASFAYFTVNGSNGTEADVSVGTSKEDILTFEVGNDINIEVTESTFKSDAGNAVGSTIAKAILISGNKDNELKAYYNLYLNITLNEFNYTSGDNTPELLLKVTDSTGIELTSISGLEYKEVIDGLGNTVKGFDITTETGLITILSNQEIIAKPSKTDIWNIDIIFVNLDINQIDNAGKSVEARLQITKSDYQKTVADLCEDKTLSECIKAQFTTQGSNGLYLHNGTIKSEEIVIDANDGSYRYAGGDYKLTQKATDAGLMEISARDNTSGNEVINFYCDGNILLIGGKCEEEYTRYYTLSYDEANTQYETYKEVLTKAVEDGYLTNNNINNYVCFGSSEDECPSDNLYRIIGVFGDEVKLIKADYATSEELGIDGAYYDSATYVVSNYSAYKGNKTIVDRYYWNSLVTSNNEWSNSLLNTINLNTNFISYLNGINSKWVSMIAETSWQVGGNPWDKIGEVKMYQTYQNEIISPTESSIYNAKIGLMYVSDYGYAASPKCWTYVSYDPSALEEDYRNAINDNWMHMGLYEWTISRLSSDMENAYIISYKGFPVDNYVSYNLAVRPTFYLNSSVRYIGGSGSVDSPLVIG